MSICSNIVYGHASIVLLCNMPGLGGHKILVKVTFPLLLLILEFTHYGRAQNRVVQSCRANSKRPSFEKSSRRTENKCLLDPVARESRPELENGGGVDDGGILARVLAAMETVL